MNMGNCLFAATLAVIATQAAAQESNGGDADRDEVVACISSALSLADVQNHIANELGTDTSADEDWMRHANAFIELSSSLGVAGDEKTYAEILARREGSNRGRIQIMQVQDPTVAFPIFADMHRDTCQSLYDYLEEVPVSEDQARQCIRSYLMVSVFNDSLSDEPWFPPEIRDTEIDISMPDIRTMSARVVYHGGSAISNDIINEESSAAISFVEENSSVERYKAELARYWNVYQGFCHEAFKLD